MQLIIYAHPDKNSFNHGVLESVKAAFDKKNMPYQVIDLYEMNYNPVATTEEIRGKNSEQTIALQQQIKAAKNIIFIFPVFWFRAPAIMEGFFDKVFTPGFAYRFKKIIGKYGMPIPLLKDKKVRAFISHGAPAAPVKTLYVNAVKFRFLLGFLSFCFNLFRCRIYQFWAVPFVSTNKREKYLRKAARVVSRLEQNV
jgi:NAD(P)H dehydrogenase (quinone)